MMTHQPKHSVYSPRYTDEASQAECRCDEFYACPLHDPLAYSLNSAKHIVAGL